MDFRKSNPVNISTSNNSKDGCWTFLSFNSHYQFAYSLLNAKIQHKTCQFDNNWIKRRFSFYILQNFQYNFIIMLCIISKVLIITILITTLLMGRRKSHQRLLLIVISKRNLIRIIKTSPLFPSFHFEVNRLWYKGRN